MNRIRAYRAAKGWSLQQLATASGTTKSQIDKLEKGQRRLTVDWMVRLAGPLGCDPRALMTEGSLPGLEAVPFATPAVPTGLLPVRGMALPLATKSLTPAPSFAAAAPIDRIACPPLLAHVRDAYALYVGDATMSPMYRPRQLLFINPHKLPAAGGGVVVIGVDGSVRLREYVRPKTAGVVLREYQPAQRDLSIAHSEIASLHSVVGALEPQ